MDELVRDLAPPVVGLLAAGVGLLYGRHIKRQYLRRQQDRHGSAHPAE